MYIKFAKMAEIAPLCSVGPFDLLSIIYANIKNALCNSIALCPHIICTKYDHRYKDNG